MNLYIRRATSNIDWRMCKDFVDLHHSYIKWSDRPSRKLYWLLYEEHLLVGVFGLGSAFARPKAITTLMQEKNIAFNEMANNIVFCLFGHINKNAGTQFLSLLRKDAVKWWWERYNNELKCFQTFILPPRTGAVYKADNWTELGFTFGASTQVKTIRPDKVTDHSGSLERREFKSGEVRFLSRQVVEVPQKLILIKEVSDKERKKILKDAVTNERNSRMDNDWF